jgi:translation initiation factor IF-2
MATQKNKKKKNIKPVKSVELDSKTDKELYIEEPIVVKTFAELLGKKPTEIIMALMQLNILASINQTIDIKTAEKIASNHGYKLLVEKSKKENSKIEEKKKIEIIDDPKDLVERPPVVTFMGHVDHGKTSIQDAIRKTSIVKGEAGGITQHTGASVIDFKKKTIVFIDTPGHEAFTEMRSRGANVTDIVVLVVAADDGFMPQTVEALNHARAANVPIIVAINKIDLPSADPEKVLLHMQQNNLMSEDWGGEVGTVQVSAMTGKGLDDLLDRILLETELLELKANPKRASEGVILEAELELGMGSTANAIVKNGTLKVGDIILCDHYYGRIKALIDSSNKRVKTAGPSMPVKIVGLSGVPSAGSIFTVCTTEKEAAEIAKQRGESFRTENLTKASVTSLEDLFSSINEAKRNDLNLIIKTDVQGTGEAIKDSLEKILSDKIRVNIVHNAVGGISESDILLASASKAIVVGFHVKVNNGVNDIAKKEGVEIRLYSIIYEVIADIKDALVGRLAPEARERHLAKAKILKIFSTNKGPKICGCVAEEGTVKVGGKARVYRNKDLIFNGIITSLRRFQDDVKEVKAGQECGIRLDNFLDFQEGDIIEVYDIVMEKASL